MEGGLQNYYKESRPWGNFERFTNNEASTVKIINVNVGQQFSLQKHSKRSEFWRVVAGSGSITVGEDVHEAQVGDEFFIPVGTIHRAQGGDEGLQILEVALGEFDENDIERIEDDYGRV